MIEKILTVAIDVGICARPASRIVQIASLSKSQVTFSKCDESCTTADGRSIMLVMMLGASKGTKLVCRVTGPDEEETMGKMEELFEGKFGMG